MLKSLFNQFTFICIAAATFAPAFAAEKVSLTRHAYDEGTNLFQTYEADVPLATCIRPKEGSNDWKFVLLSDNVEYVYSFTITAPDNYYKETLHFAGASDRYIQEFLVTQHLFNEDDLYEVVFTNYDETLHQVYNEKGECLGEIPNIALFKLGDTTYIYAEYDRDTADNSVISALYSINKSGSSVSSLKASNEGLLISPNPTKAEEVLTVTLPETASIDLTVKVYSIDGKMMIQRKCEQGMQAVNLPASMLSPGINPVVVFDADGNAVYTGKIVRE